MFLRHTTRSLLVPSLSTQCIFQASSPLLNTSMRGIKLTLETEELPKPTFQRDPVYKSVIYPIEPPVRYAGEELRSMVERIMKLSSTEIQQEIYRRQKELLVWRRVILN